MKLTCMPCFVKQVLMEINGSDMPYTCREKAIRASLKTLSEMDYDLPPVEVSLILHNKLVEAGSGKDPYLHLKRKSTKKALDIVHDMESMLDGSDDRLRMAALMAIAGNVVDYGAANELDLETTLINAVESGPGIDDINKFREELEKARSITYLLDNSGEVVFDGLFIKEILNIKPDIQMKVFAKKSPLLNDVTVKDAKEAGLDEIHNVELEELPHEGWVLPDDIPSIRGDIVISKGQGNYESLSDLTNIYFLLVVKCNVVSEELGSAIGKMVFKKS